MIRKLFFLATILLLTILTACGQSSSGNSDLEGESFVLKVGIVMNDNDPMYDGIMKFKEGVEERTNGNVEVEVYPSSQLGDTGDLLEQAKVGANIATLIDAGPLGDMVKEISILQAPYIVDNLEEAQKLVTSDLFKEWEAQLEPEGLKVLSFNWFQGSRHLATTKPVTMPQDLNGMAIRTNGSAIVNKAIETMGGNPTGLAWAESYPGLQQGVIDGVEAHYSAIYGARLPEVVSSISKTGHFQLLTGLTVGMSWFNSLPGEYQAIVVEEAANAGAFATNINVEKEQEYEEQIKAEGVEIIEVDINEFKEMSNQFYEDLPELEEVREQVNQALGKS
ncbi:C4-dicarboxylate TRAP transporter substrate-binding protein [Alkalihalobacillus deserti]|uniref:C4-dicarboxylate TRAP transporter substrate-binding protein n=1 Tax=Alkalihalobacillus deserti TaxID=2879466 RepID=UPI001D1499B5|nr:C4-dicarboxylate TRAP transporter substrate-binding protein [Alkalihalobacillus deserti]